MSDLGSILEENADLGSNLEENAWTLRVTWKKMLESNYNQVKRFLHNPFYFLVCFSPPNALFFVTDHTTKLGMDAAFIASLVVWSMTKTTHLAEKSKIKSATFVTLSKSLWNHSFKSTITWPLGCKHGIIACYGESIPKGADLGKQSCLIGVRLAELGKWVFTTNIFPKKLEQILIKNHIMIHMPQRTSKILLVRLTANRNALFLIRVTSFARYTVWFGVTRSDQTTVNDYFTLSTITYFDWFPLHSWRRKLTWHVFPHDQSPETNWQHEKNFFCSKRTERCFNVLNKLWIYL